LVGIALVVGVPLGVIGGLFVWRAFADDLGISADAHVPILAFVATAVGAVVIANLLAIAPGMAAGRTRAAAVLNVHDG
jgi:hypothetical protein